MTPNIYPIYTEVRASPRTICNELKEEVFEYPFFNEGVSHCHTENSQDFELEDLMSEKRNDGLILKGFIFHTSHCGSTLLSGMLGKLSQVKIVSEPEAINGLLLSSILYELKAEEIIDKLRKIVRLYCQKNGPEKHVIIKVTSWNVFMIGLILKSFPGAK